MAYTPPHKRHSKDSNKPAPIPEMLVPIFKRNLYLSPSKDRSGKIVYADQAISRWFAVGLDENNQFPSSVHLEPVSLKSVERRSGEGPLVLLNGNMGKVAEKAEISENVLGSQWGFIAENVWQDLLSSFRNARNDKDVKSSLVARFGKILFHGSHSVGLKSAGEGPVTESVLRQLKRTFNTNVPNSYAEEVSNELVTEVGFDFEGEKDIYQVKLSDRKQPDCTISCKCIVNKDRSLELYKVQLNPVRHMVVDLSCVDKNLDLRLALCTKKILTDLVNDEMQSITDIIAAAILDPDVKGGLRWPLGKSYSDRYNVVGVWHTVTKSYHTESLRLKVRQADRFDFKAARGDASVEVSLRLKRVALKILTSMAFTSVVVAAVPTLVAMGRAATSLAKLADTAREELPSTMAAIRLSGMEISDLTLELSDLSQEIADGVNKSAQAVQAAEAGIRQFGALARQQTISMIQERASLPVISLKPVVTGAAKKTSRAVGQATKTVMNIISGGEFGSENEGDNSIDRVEI